MGGLFFSIIIPTYQRPDLVKNCIEKLLVQELQNGVGYEIIVGDDSPSEETKRCIEENFPSVRWVRSPGKGPAANRNFAAKRANGEWLIFIDDDTEPQPGFLKGYFEMASTSQYQVLEGKILCPNKRNSPFYRMPENLTGNIFASGNIAFHRNTFNELGAFDEDLVVMEDMEMAHRIRASGITHKFCPRAVVDHRAQPLGWKYMVWWAKHHRWGILYDFKTGKRNPSAPIFSSMVQTCLKHLVLLLRTTWHLVSQHDPATWKNRWFWQVWGWICLPYTMVNLCASEIQFRKLARDSHCDKSISADHTLS